MNYAISDGEKNGIIYVHSLKSSTKSLNMYSMSLENPYKLIVPSSVTVFMYNYL
jgi:hypothetical protein